MDVLDDELLPHERRDLIQEIQLDTFRHLQVEDVRWVTSWALTLAAMPDETIIRIWNGIHGGR
jgi:hypothetical protein